MQEGNGKQRRKRNQDVAEVEEDVAGVDPAQAAKAARPKTKKSPPSKKGRATTAAAKEEQLPATEEQLQAAEDQLPPPAAATATATVSTRPPAILAGKKIPMAQPQLQPHGPVGGGMQPPVELRGAPPYALESLVPGTYHRIMQILDPDPDVAATPACPMQVPRGTCPECEVDTMRDPKTGLKVTARHVAATARGLSTFNKRGHLLLKNGGNKIYSRSWANSVLKQCKFNFLAAARLQACFHVQRHVERAR